MEIKKTGTCKHGTFPLSEGCAQCIAEREQGAGDVPPSFGGKTGDAPPLSGGTTAEFESTEHEGETAIALRPGEDVEARGYFEEGQKLLKYAEARVIATPEDVKSVNDDLSLISKLKKAMDNKRKSLLDPLKLQADAIRETYTFLMAPVLEATKIYHEKMLAYDAEQKRIRLKQEEINRKREEAAKAEMELKGEVTEPVNLVEVAREPAKSVSTDMGTSGMVDRWKYEVIDLSLIPREYLVVDNAQLTAIARRHHDKKPIAGIRFYNDPYIASRTR